MSKQTAQYKVTVATMDGEIVEQFTTAPVFTNARRGMILREALRDAASLANMGMTEWEPEDEDE